MIVYTGRVETALEGRLLHSWAYLPNRVPRRMSCVPATDLPAVRLLASPLRRVVALQTLALERAGEASARSLCRQDGRPAPSNADHEADWEAKNRLPRNYVQLHTISRQ